MTRLPLSDEKIKKAMKEIQFITEIINFCNSKIDQSFIREIEQVVKNLITYVSHIKYSLLISPKIRKEYRDFIFSISHIYPNLKKSGLDSIYRMMEFKNNYYYIK
jgi:hypothetical protein